MTPAEIRTAFPNGAVPLEFDSLTESGVVVLVEHPEHWANFEPEAHRPATEDEYAAWYAYWSVQPD